MIDFGSVFAAAWLAGGLMLVAYLLRGNSFVHGAVQGMRASSGLHEIPGEFRPLVAIGMMSSLLGFLILWPAIVAALWWARRQYWGNRAAGVSFEAIEIPDDDTPGIGMRRRPAPIRTVPEEWICCSCGGCMEGEDLIAFDGLIGAPGEELQRYELPRVRVHTELRDRNIVTHQLCVQCYNEPGCDCGVLFSLPDPGALQ